MRKNSFATFASFMLSALALVSLSGNLAAQSGSCDHSHHSHHEHHHIKTITTKDVAGTYQLSGFTNSLSGLPPGGLQSIAGVGQATFNADGTGVFSFLNFVITIDNAVEPLAVQNAPFTYTVGPLNGLGSLTFQLIVPSLSLDATETFDISFQLKKGKVTGMSLARTSVTPPVDGGLWLLFQGERFY